MQDNNDQTQDSDITGHVNAPINPPSGGLTSFTMDPPHHDEPKIPPPPDTSGPPTLDKIEEEIASKKADNKNPALPLVDSQPAKSSLSGTNGDLSDIKQQALSQLSPMLGHLDQPPEEKFKTLLMMIQASDDQSLVKEAYETAQKITDEKAKAQALLDIVNEINYFTQSKNNSN